MTGTPASLGDAGTIAVVGLGLIGGSLARDLAARGHRVVAADRDRAALDAARAEGVIDGTFQVGAHPERTLEVEPELERAGLVVLATPGLTAIPILRWLAGAGPPGAVLTDVGSTKRSIAEAADASGVSDRFIGSHPMAGDHRSGWTSSRPGLFVDAPVWVCAPAPAPAPAPATDARALALVEAVWTEVGAIPHRIEATDHDHMVAWSSHLPQLMTSALGCVLDAAGIDRTRLGPGGRDVTRLAASDPVMWTEILMDNADAIEPALDALIDELGRLRRHVTELDDASLRATLEDARRWAESVRDPAPAAAR